MIDFHAAKRFNPLPMKTYLRLILAAVFALTAAAHAEEKNGLSLTVSKTMVEKNDTRGTGGSYDKINRTQALKASIKNLSFKEMPEGEVTWAVLLKRYSYTDTLIFTGTEKLKALKPAEITELIFGGTKITGYTGYSENYKDKTEWQITVKQDGKEIIKSQSTSAFDSLAKHAVKRDNAEKPNN